MLRQSLWICILAVAVSVCRMASPAGAAAEPSENLLPATTQGFLSVTNVPTLHKEWRATQLGQLMNSPLMKDFTEDLHRQLVSHFAPFHDRLGLTFDDFRTLPTGELCIALVQPGKDEAVRVVLMDVTGHVDQVKALLKRSTDELLQRKATQKTIDFQGTKVLIFDVPRPAMQNSGPPNHTVYWLYKDTVFAAVENLEVAKAILAKTALEKGDSLGSQKSFHEVMARCKKDAGDVAPSVRWYIQPLGYAEAARTATPEESRRKGKSIYEVMRNVGFGGLQGIGGYVNLHSEHHEILHRTCIYAPPPYQKSMKMLVFPNTQDLIPQRWVPRDVAMYISLSCDILNAFDNFGPLFDELYGEGEKGVWGDIVEGFEKDPHGPQINLRKEIIQNLKQRVSIMSDYQLPITPQSERMLYAIEVKDEKAVEKAIAKWMKGTPTAKKREVKGHIVWEMVEEEDDQEIPTLDLESPGDEPKAKPAIPAEPKPKAKPEDAAPKDATPKETTPEKAGAEKAPPAVVIPAKPAAPPAKVMPHMAVTIAHGHLLIASHMDFLEKILTLPAEANILARDKDYTVVANNIKELGLPDSCARFFSRTDEECRPTYELLRQGKMPEAETMLAKLLNAVLDEGEKGAVRKQWLDGKNLPDYEKVRPYLGLGGGNVQSEPNGWFLKGFLLHKDEAAAPLPKSLPNKPEVKAEGKKEVKKEVKKEGKKAAAAEPKPKSPSPAKP